MRTRQAKAQGYPARSVFKLQEIDQKLVLFRAGQRVLDLGAAPGSWSLYASGRVGREGRVVAVDVSEIRLAMPANVTVIRADVNTLDIQELAAFAPFAVVLSDMAPNTSGSKVSDQAQSCRLFMLALSTAQRLGQPGSSFVGKLFMGPDFQVAQRAMREQFEQVRVIRPQGTRPHSSELFLVGLRFGLGKAERTGG
jgi:23S rRNA (uridine2552-2'-O)-methyltransferase